MIFVQKPGELRALLRHQGTQTLQAMRPPCDLVDAENDGSTQSSL